MSADYMALQNNKQEQQHVASPVEERSVPASKGIGSNYVTSVQVQEAPPPPRMDKPNSPRFKFHPGPNLDTSLSLSNSRCIQRASWSLASYSLGGHEGFHFKQATQKGSQLVLHKAQLDGFIKTCVFLGTG
mmetsp:Transcript_46293/g.134153  ORF Transcript_46293/g.134153 Transcript_46293/m.134153 type:complete len:131 (-) Transcript_46293:1206-1598(-)